VRSGYLSNSVSIELATSNLTATAGLDYVGQTNTLTFASGETNKTVLISLLSDSEPEPVETFQVRLRNPGGGAVIGSRSNATVRMIDDTPGALDASFNQAPPHLILGGRAGRWELVLCGSFWARAGHHAAKRRGLGQHLLSEQRPQRNVCRRRASPMAS
jgi:hypothetical protein